MRAFCHGLLPEMVRGNEPPPQGGALSRARTARFSQQPGSQCRRASQPHGQPLRWYFHAPLRRWRAHISACIISTRRSCSNYGRAKRTCCRSHISRISRSNGCLATGNRFHHPSRRRRSYSECFLPKHSKGLYFRSVRLRQLFSGQLRRRFSG